MGLNGAQKRKLTIVLRMFEKELAHVEELMDADAEGILYRRVTRLNEQEKSQLRGLAKVGRETLARLKERFDLTVDTEDGRGIILSHFVQLWVDLQEIRPQELRSSGEVDPVLYETLEPDLLELIQVVRSVPYVLGAVKNAQT